MTTLTFAVFGRPQPAGSKKAYVNPKTGKAVITDDAKHSRPWKQHVAEVAQSELRVRNLYRDGPTADAVRVELVFVLARPKGHYGTGRNVESVRASAPAFPTSRPDVDKLSRAVLDSLTGVVWRDDAQVVLKTVRKVYGVPERVVVTVEPMVSAGGVHTLGAAA